MEELLLQSLKRRHTLLELFQIHIHVLPEDVVAAIVIRPKLYSSELWKKWLGKHKGMLMRREKDIPVSSCEYVL